MAAPVVAGSAALVVQGFREANGFSPTHETVKAILKSTAVDLGYDPFVQGAGRVDCYGAVSLAMGTAGVTVFSEATWQNGLEAIQFSAWINSELSYDLIPAYGPPPIGDTSWFAGTVNPGESTTAEFTVFNPSSGDASLSISAVVHKQVGSTIVISGSTSSMPEDWALMGWTWGNLTKLSESLIPKDTELMTVSLAFSYDYFDPEMDYVWNQSLRVMIQDWNDIDSDDNIDVNEVWQINYGYNTGTSNIATVGFPQSKFKGAPTIFVYQRSNGIPLESVPFKLYIRFYKRIPWSWVTLSSTSFTVPSNDYAVFNATLTVPSDVSQGVYEGQIIVNIGARKLAVPVSVNVPTVVPTGQLVYDVEKSEYGGPYNPFTVEGYFDWNWRYEAGDWKNWLFDISDPSTIAAFVYADWEGNMTDIDMFGIHPLGLILDGTGEYWMSDGVFQWNTRTGSTEEYVFLYTGPLPDTSSISIPDLYTVLLHNVFFNGTVFPENLSCSVKMINLDPAPPTQFMIPTGESESLTFTLSTGMKLTDVTLYPSGPFEIKISPNGTDEISEMGSYSFEVTINVPSSASPGMYQCVIYLAASEFPSNLYLPIFINIVVPTIEKVDVIIDVGEIHFSGELAQVYIQIADKGLPVNLTDSLEVKLWYRTADGTFLSMNFNAKQIDIGLYTAEFEVPAEATSCCLVTQVECYFNDTNVLYRGTAMNSFDLSATLNGWNAYVTGIYGDIGIIKSDVGVIRLNLTSIGATLKSLNGTEVEIKTLLGEIKADIYTLGLKVTVIDGNVTIIKTSLGELKGVIQSIEDDVVTIKTDIGTVKVNVEDIEGFTENLPQTTSQNLTLTWTAIILAFIAAACSATILIKLGRKKAAGEPSLP